MLLAGCPGTAGYFGNGTGNGSGTGGVMVVVVVLVVLGGGAHLVFQLAICFWVLGLPLF